MKHISLLLLPLFLAGFLFAQASADQNDKRLDDLFRQLQESRDPAESNIIEARIWEIWTDSGNLEINALMSQGIQAMSVSDLDKALRLFDRIVELAPDFAEGWNKRATVYYLRDELDASVRDVQRTLALESRHFGAISGMGLIFIEVGDDVGALRAFEDVLTLYPQSRSAQFHIERLRARLDGNTI